MFDRGTSNELILFARYFLEMVLNIRKTKNLLAMSKFQHGRQPSFDYYRITCFWMLKHNIVYINDVTTSAARQLPCQRGGSVARSRPRFVCTSNSGCELTSTWLLILKMCTHAGGRSTIEIVIVLCKCLKPFRFFTSVPLIWLIYFYNFTGRPAPGHA